MLRTLYSKLAAVLLGLFALVGVVSIVGTLHFFQLYNEESNQRLNQPLAGIWPTRTCCRTWRTRTRSGCARMFDMQMIINPSIQIYLLDAAGRIVAFSAAPGEVKLERVDLAPMRAFLDHGAKFPIHGDDPRDPGARRIFSVRRSRRRARPRGICTSCWRVRVRPGWRGCSRQSDIVPVAAGVAGAERADGTAGRAGHLRADDAQAGASGRGHGRVPARGLHRAVRSAAVAKHPGGDEIDRLAIDLPRDGLAHHRAAAYVAPERSASARAGGQCLARPENADRDACRATWTRCC